jgi:hypothetical protein
MASLPGFSVDVESRTLSAAKPGPTIKRVAITPAAKTVIRFIYLTSFAHCALVNDEPIFRSP